MVREYNAAVPVRSFVKIKSTGSDKDATPIVCDLSRVANIPRAKKLPDIILKSGIKKTNVGISGEVNKGMKRPLSQDEGDKQAPSEKVRKIITTGDLLTERNRLINKNRELSKKLEMFRALFKDRVKLGQVLRKLDESKAS